MNTAVLFLVFNRPETTRQVFEAIRRARPPRLYVVADGARPDRAGEVGRCDEVRRIATAVDWPCDVYKLFRDANLGCKRGVSGGIDWFFAHEDEGIILEDDVLPQPSFFRFCEELLERYRGDQRVSMISGCNLVGTSPDPGDSYFFSRYMHIWGWATWRRAWGRYDVAIPGWPSSAATARLAAILHGRANAIRYWSAVFDRVARGEIDTWDYQWVHAAWMDDLIAIMPARNLVDNLGFGADATHTVGSAPAAVAAAKSVDVAFPLRHPDPASAAAGSAAIDAAIELRVLEISARSQFAARVRTLPVIRKLMSLYRGAVSW